MSDPTLALNRMRRRMPRALARRFGDDADRGRSHSMLRRDEASLGQFDALLSHEAEVAAVPGDLLKAICWYASGWRQFEPGGRVLTTPSGQGSSYGCMQLNDVWHPDAFPAAQHDAQGSIRYAANLLRWLYEQTGDWHRATIAFFGHDHRAEVAARRVRGYASRRPWVDRLAAVLPAAEAMAAARQVAGREPGETGAHAVPR